MIQDNILRLSSKIIKSVRKSMPNMKESLDLAETPFDLLIDFVNFWARFTGLESMKIDKVSSKYH